MLRCLSRKYFSLANKSVEDHVFSIVVQKTVEICNNVPLLFFVSVKDLFRIDYDICEGREKSVWLTKGACGAKVVLLSGETSNPVDR
jgi:hypothetical protein